MSMERGISSGYKVVTEILKELHLEEKPVVVIFNKMDLYEKTRFDEFLPAEIKTGLLNELQETWMARTHQNCIFISATQNRNTADLRQLLFQKVKQLYLERYPYKAGYFQTYNDYEGQGEMGENSADSTS